MIKIKDLSIEEAFGMLKKGYKVSRESWLDGDYYAVDEEDILYYFSSTENKRKIGIISFLTPLNVNDWMVVK